MALTLQSLKERARQLRKDTYALYLAARHPLVPWYAKALIGLIVAYALSPIDLIPDFIPVVGYLDDLVLIPLGIAMAVKLVPKDVLAQCREKAETVFAQQKPVSMGAAIVIGLIWAAALFFAGRMLWKLFR